MARPRTKGNRNSSIDRFTASCSAAGNSPAAKHPLVTTAAAHWGEQYSVNDGR